MLNVRQVVLIFLLLTESSGFAASGSIQTSIESVTTQGNSSSFFQESSASTSQTQSLQLISPGIKTSGLRILGLSGNGQLVLSSKTQISQPLESQLVVKDSKGKESRLNEQRNLSLIQSEFGTAYSQGMAEVSLRYGQSLDQSDFQQRNLIIGYLHQFNSGTTKLALQHQKQDQDQPLTYYFDNASSNSSLKWRQRPTRITQNKASLSLEQIWTEQLKSKTDLLWNQRSQSRPTSFGIAQRQLFAIHSRQFLRLDLGVTQDQRNELLVDERGYYSIRWIEFALNQGLTYNLWLSPSYGYLQELEDRVQSADRSQTGTDVYGLKLKYKGRGWIADLNLETSQSNTDYQTQKIQGGFLWELW